MTIKFDKDTAKAFDKSKVSKPMGRNILSSRLDLAFQQMNEPWSFVYEPKGHDLGWHPSGDCLPDVQHLYESAYVKLHPETGQTKDLSRLNKTFMVGHYWHQIIQYLVVKTGMADEECIERVAFANWGDVKSRLYGDFDHTKLKPFHYVRGQADIVPLEVPGWKGLVDIKTMNSMDFAHLAKSQLPPRWQKKYIAQANIYMDLHEQEQALILAVNKDSGAFAEFTFVKDQLLIDAIYEKWEFASYCIAHDTVPTDEDNELFALPFGDEN